MQVTFLRHGQSEHNAGLTSFLDSALTPLGNQQSEAAAARFVEEGLTSENTTSYVSPLLRTLQTLEPTIRSLNLYAEVFADVREYFSIRNDGYRTFIGLTPAQIGAQFPWATLGSNIGFEDEWWPRELEDDFQLYARCCIVRDRLIEEHLNSGKNLLIVSHADPIGRMIEAFLRVPPDPEGPPWSGNCGITRLLVSDNTSPAEIVFLNDLIHLSSETLLSPR
jgi:broad specificity phosphatase PhoE